MGPQISEEIRQTPAPDARLISTAANRPVLATYLDSHRARACPVARPADRFYKECRSDSSKRVGTAFAGGSCVCR